MVTSEALKTINKVGYIPFVNLPSNTEMIEVKQMIDSNLDNYVALANNKKIGSYAHLYNVEEIKQALYLYKTPVIVCFDVDEYGLQLDENYVAYVPTKPYGGHATVCYGWNEIGLLIQNSWGEDWGNNGTFILPYEYPWYEAWLISFKALDNNENEDESNQEPEIEKPDYYLIRKIIMAIVKFICKLFHLK